MPHLEAKNTLHLVERPLLYCSSCRKPLYADSVYVTCLSCDGALCRECNMCDCEQYERQHIHLVSPVFKKSPSADAVLCSANY